MPAAGGPPAAPGSGSPCTPGGAPSTFPAASSRFSTAVGGLGNPAATARSIARQASAAEGSCRNL
eukprot:5043581-Pyramimonas_sp.AAC.1